MRFASRPTCDILAIDSSRRHTLPADEFHMNPGYFSRRELLRRCGMGFGGLALGQLMSESGLHAAEASTSPMAPKFPHFPAKAKHVIHLFMNGGPSHLDTFDPKPLLAKYHGKPLPTSNLRTERKTGAAMRSPFGFKK